VELADASALLAQIPPVSVVARIGECPMLNIEDVSLFRSSLGCAHLYCAQFIRGRLEDVVAGAFCCTGCIAEDLNYNADKYKGFISLSLLKGYVEAEVMEHADAVRIVLQMMKTFSKEFMMDIDVHLRNGNKRCPRPECNAYILHQWAHGCHHTTCVVCNIHFCYRCMNYLNDGSTYFDGIGGCPTDGCTAYCSEDITDCFCAPCETCQPGVSCALCDGPNGHCTSCKIQECMDFEVWNEDDADR